MKLLLLFALIVGGCFGQDSKPELTVKQLMFDIPVSGRRIAPSYLEIHGSQLPAGTVAVKVTITYEQDGHTRTAWALAEVTQRGSIFAMVEIMNSPVTITAKVLEPLIVGPESFTY